MFFSSRPDDQTIHAFLRDLETAPLSYEPVGLCRTSPRGFSVDVHRERIGTGEADLERARQALDSFAGVRLGWADVVSEKPTAELGSNVVVIATHRPRVRWPAGSRRSSGRIPPGPWPARWRLPPPSADRVSPPTG